MTKSTIENFDAELDERRERDRELAAELLRALGTQAKSLGFAEFRPPEWETADLRLERDPSDGVLALKAQWYHSRGQRLGELTIREDGHCYGECDILRPHPGDRRWFVEAVTVWGVSSSLKGDPRLLPSL